MVYRDRDSFAALVQTGIERGLDVVEAWRAARDSRPSRDLAQRRQQAIAAHQREVRAYERRQSRLSARIVGGTAVAGVAGTVGVIDVIAEVTTAQAGVYGPSWIWLGGAIVGAVVAVTGRSARARLAPPPEFTVPAAPPPTLPRDAIGAAEAGRLIRLRVQLAELVPALERLQPDAAQELRRADLEAAPPLHALIERLDVLDRMRRELGPTKAGHAARVAAEDVRVRLDAGCVTYEQLLTASASLLAAPDVSRSTAAVLSPAVQALQAYTHGLQRSADAFGD